MSHPESLLLKNVASRSPYTIRADETLTKARDVMQEHHILHLVVLENGKLAGLISERDLLLGMTLSGNGNTPVEEVMASDVYAVDVSAPLAEIVFHMATHKLGSAIALENGEVSGIFTSIDALKVLGEILAGK